MRKLAASIHMCAASVATAVELDRTPPEQTWMFVVPRRRLHTDDFDNHENDTENKYGNESISRDRVELLLGHVAM